MTGMEPSKTLDQKLARLAADPEGARDFVICDAKDPDMAWGCASPGPVFDDTGAATGRFRSRRQFQDQIRAIVTQGVVDMVLMSMSNLHQLQIEERIFDGSSVTPAARLNDTTDVWNPRHGGYSKSPARPFRTARIDHAMYGRLDPEPGIPVAGTDIGLYAVTFNNDIAADHATLEAFAAFRDEAERKGFRYFLEVFNPNVACGIAPEDMPFYVNDSIARCLAGVPKPARPVFLKIVYNGPRALDELVSWDPSVIVGILGGGAGTTHDTFKLLHDGQRYGARVALFGRKINLAEDPLLLIALMRRVVEGEVTPEEAVRHYHDGLAREGLRPRRSLEDDLAITEAVLRD